MMPARFGVVAHTCPPAKLNLFLELLERRDDGFHEIDTVMVPIDWCDELHVHRTREPQIQLQVDWLPSRQVLADRLGIDLSDSESALLLDLPADEKNLVHQALRKFVDVFGVDGGFSCRLDKRIPAGAGMGGASSDAASALRCAAKLTGIAPDDARLIEVAASIGSDVPFFLGVAGDDSIKAARATGRGEKLDAVDLITRLDLVVVYPAVSLSTAKVYANSQVPLASQNACRLMEMLSNGDLSQIETGMMNRLTDPAKKLAPQIEEILESLWRMELRTCQLTGSGSACFAIASSSTEAKRATARLRAMLEPGAIVVTARSTSVPSPVDLT